MKPPSTRENPKSSSGSQNSQQNSKFQARTAQGTRKATVANPDAWGRLIGPQNLAPIKIDGEEAMVLLDGGAQISSISRKWVDEMGLQFMNWKIWLKLFRQVEVFWIMKDIQR